MSALGNKPAGAAASLAIVLAALAANVCLAQPLHRPLEPRQSLTPHPSAAAIGGPTRAAGATAREPRFPVSPAGVLVAKAPSPPREIQHAAAKLLDAPSPAARPTEPPKRLAAAPRQNHLPSTHLVK